MASVTDTLVVVLSQFCLLLLVSKPYASAISIACCTIQNISCWTGKKSCFSKLKKKKKKGGGEGKETIQRLSYVFIFYSLFLTASTAIKILAISWQLIDKFSGTFNVFRPHTQEKLASKMDIQILFRFRMFLINAAFRVVKLQEKKMTCGLQWQMK